MDMPDGDPHSSLPLAMVYSLPQSWDGIYDTDIALYRGTLFSALDKPFLGAKWEDMEDE